MNIYLQYKTIESVVNPFCQRRDIFSWKSGTLEGNLGASRPMLLCATLCPPKTMKIMAIKAVKIFKKPETF